MDTTGSMDTTGCSCRVDKVVAEPPLGAVFATSPLLQFVSEVDAAKRVAPTVEGASLPAVAPPSSTTSVDRPIERVEEPAARELNAVLYSAPAKEEFIPALVASKRPRLVVAAMAALCLIAVVQAFLLLREVDAGASGDAAAPEAGTVSVESTPAGATVSVEGRLLGETPLKFALDPGKYSIEVKNGGHARTLSVAVAAGSSSNQHIIFGDEGTAVPPTQGGLQITSQPSGARVTIDGAAVGVTPLTVSALRPGNHAVVLDGPSGSSRQSVTVRAGTTSSLAVTMPVAGASAGWVRVVAPFDVRLLENGVLIGTTQTERIMLPTGRHVLDAENASLGYRATQTVEVSPGGETTMRLEAPQTDVNINATPWADVTAGGKALGTTPLGNISMPIGTHEIIFRHPQLGERRLTTTVTVNGPNRVSVSMNQR
jgi:hypothetical protein